MSDTAALAVLGLLDFRSVAPKLNLALNQLLTTSHDDNGFLFDELCTVCVSAAIELVEAVKFELGPTADAVVLQQLYNFTDDITRLCVSLTSAARVADGERSQKLNVRPAKQSMMQIASQLDKQTKALVLLAQSHAPSTAPQSRTFGGDPEYRLQIQAAGLRDSQMLTAIFSKSVSQFVNVMNSELKVFYTYTVADVVIAVGRIVSYVQTVLQTRLKEAPSALLDEFNRKKSGMIDDLVKKTDNLTQQAKLAGGYWPPADIKDIAVQSAKSLAEAVKMFLVQAKQANIHDQKIPLPDPAPGFRDMLLVIIIDRRASGLALHLELTTKLLVIGISKLLEGAANRNVQSMQDALQVVQRAAADVTSDSPSSTTTTSIQNGGGDGDSANKSPSGAASPETMSIHEFSEPIEALLIPVVKNVARLAKEIDSGWATSEEYLESLHLIKSTAQPLILSLDPTHPLANKLLKSLGQLTLRTKLAAGVWPGPTAVQDMRSEAFNVAMLLKAIHREETSDGSSVISSTSTSSPTNSTFPSSSGRDRSGSILIKRSVSQQQLGSTRGDNFSSFAQDDPPPPESRMVRSSSLGDSIADLSDELKEPRRRSASTEGDFSSVTTANLSGAVSKLVTQVKLHCQLLSTPTGTVKGTTLGESEIALKHNAQQVAIVAKTVISSRMPAPRPDDLPPPQPHALHHSPSSSSLASSTGSIHQELSKADIKLTAPIVQQANAGAKAAFISYADSNTPKGASGIPTPQSPKESIAVRNHSPVGVTSLSSLTNIAKTAALKGQVFFREQVTREINTLLASHKPGQEESSTEKIVSDEFPAIPANNVFVSGIALPNPEFDLLMSDDLKDLILELPTLPAGPNATETKQTVNPSGASSATFFLRSIIKGGTVQKLIERLTYYKYPDPDYTEAFLLTYRSFTQPIDVLNGIISKYEQDPPLNLSKAQFDLYYKTKIIPTRLRVINVLKTWVDKHFEDFDEPQLEERLISFTSEKRTHHYYQANAFQNAANQLRKLFDKKKQIYQESIKMLLMSRNLPANISSVSLTLKIGDVDPVELAKQLTIIDHNLYRAIKPKECLNQAWNRVELRHQSPNIMAFIQRFNDLTKRVTYEILSSESKKDRAALIKQFIAVAEKCYSLNNFNSLNAILAALTSSSVRRLNKSWENVAKKTIASFEQLDQQMSHNSNYLNYRNILHTADPPCVPFLGVSLTDLVFIEQGNKDLLGTNLVNFEKCRKTAVSIREIQQYQQTPYELSPIPSIQQMILQTDGSNLSDDDFYELSMKLEARKPSTPASVRN